MCWSVREWDGVGRIRRGGAASAATVATIDDDDVSDSSLSPAPLSPLRQRVSEETTMRKLPTS